MLNTSATFRIRHSAFRIDTYQRSDPTPLRRPATIVRNSGDVADRLHLDADRLERADRGFAAGPWPLHPHLDAAHPDPLRSIAGVDGGLGRRERRALARV